MYSRTAVEWQVSTECCQCRRLFYSKKKYNTSAFWVTSSYCALWLLLCGAIVQYFSCFKWVRYCLVKLKAIVISIIKRLFFTNWYVIIICIGRNLHFLNFFFKSDNKYEHVSCKTIFKKKKRLSYVICDISQTEKRKKKHLHGEQIKCFFFKLTSSMRHDYCQIKY